MKPILHGLLGLTLLLLLVTAGVGLIYGAYAGPACWDALLNLVRDERGWGIVIGLALLFLVLAYLVTGIRRKVDADQYLTFKSDGGHVSILLRAVNDFIAKVGEEFAAVISLKPSVIPRGRGSVEIQLDVRVRAGTQIPELCQLLQERVRESVRQSLGISDVRKIEVHIRDIVGTPEPSVPDDLAEQPGV